MFKDAGLVQDVVNFITAAKDRPLCLPRSDADDE
jgi:UDP-N-acetylglucosamine acyltransferase